MRLINLYCSSPHYGEIDHVGPTINIENIEATKLLRELGLINLRRQQIIDTLMKK